MQLLENLLMFRAVLPNVDPVSGCRRPCGAISDDLEQVFRGLL
jgi:hypothetical protein